MAGRDDLRWQDLRHSSLVLTAATGATLAELMARAGHSTPQAAMRYQHVASGRGRELIGLALTGLFSLAYAGSDTPNVLDAPGAPLPAERGYVPPGTPGGPPLGVPGTPDGPPVSTTSGVPPIPGVVPAARA